MAEHKNLEPTIGGKLSSWSNGKIIGNRSEFVLQGYAGGNWVTIPTDQYELWRRDGLVIARSFNNSMQPVDWTAYLPAYGGGGFRATYTLYDPVTRTRTTYTNEVQSFGYMDEVPLAIEPETGTLVGGAARNLCIENSHFAEDLQSDGFVTGAQGWRISRDGDAEFNNVVVRGTIYASVGSVGGWTISSGALTANNAVLDSQNQELRLGSGNNIVILDAADPTYRLWVGNASAGDAPFRVTQSGAVTATNIDLAGGNITGNFTVSGILRNAASGARYELSAAGLRGYDAGDAQRYQLSNDGSGWLGSPTVLSWTAAGVVSINGQAIIANTVDANKTTFTHPTVSGLGITNNSPSAGYVSWTSFQLVYRGTNYTINAGNSNAKYIYWDINTPTTLQTSANIPAFAPHRFVVIVNISGIAHPSNFTMFVYGDYIAANTIVGSHIASSTITGSHIAANTITSSNIAANTITGSNIAGSTITGSNIAANTITADKLSVTELSAISANLGNITAGTITGATIKTSGTGRVEISQNLFGSGSAGIGVIDNGGNVQWYSYAADGTIVAGGVRLNSNGITLMGGTSYNSSLSIKFMMAGATYSEMYLLNDAFYLTHANSHLVPDNFSTVIECGADTTKTIHLKLRGNLISQRSGFPVYIDLQTINSTHHRVDYVSDVHFFQGRFTVNDLTVNYATNIVNEANFGFATFIRAAYASGNLTIRGILGGIRGRIIYLINHANFSFVLAHQNINAAANNRIITPSGADVTCRTATLIYDDTTARWRLVAYA